MTEEEFAEELTKRHKTITSVVLSDIRNLIRPLTNDKRDDLFDWYLGHWKSSNCPKPGFFSEYLRDTHTYIRPKGLINGAWICGKCKTKYSLNSQGCPRCGSGATDGLTDAAHPSVIEVKTDCWHCRIYHDDEGYRYGPECKEWGTGSRPYDYCRDCRCKPCCIYETNYRKDSKTGDRPMPWIAPRSGKEKPDE